MKEPVKELPVAVVLQLLEQRAAEAVKRAPVDLPPRDHRIDDGARVVHGGVARRILMAAVPGSTSTAITSAMKPYVFDELMQSS